MTGTPRKRAPRKAAPAKATTPHRKVSGKDGGAKAQSGRPNGARQSTNHEDWLVRAVKALKLRAQGHGYRAIGEEIGVSAQQAWRDVKRILAETVQEASEDARAIEVQRRELALAAAFAVLEANPGTELALKAVDRIGRLSSSIAELLGLNLPSRLDVTLTERTQVDMELQELLDEAAARNARIAAELGVDDPATPAAS